MVSAPRLFLSTMSEGISIPDDGKGTRAVLTVTNRGTYPTMLTHMIVFTYDNWWKRLRDKPTKTAIINSPNIPAKVEANAYWMGYVLYDDDLRKKMKAGKVYIGVYATHSDKKYLKRLVPPKESKIPTANREDAPGG